MGTAMNFPFFVTENAGAAMVDLDQIQVHPLGDPINDCGYVAENPSSYAFGLDVWGNNEQKGGSLCPGMRSTDSFYS